MTTKKVTNIFKLRAECLSDVNLFMMEMLKVRRGFFMVINLEQKKIGKAIIPDCTMEFSTTMGLEQIKEVLAVIPDGHVMLETVALKSDYTGERVA